MALGMMIPGMFSGEIQEAVGYSRFFIWVVLCTIPGFIAPAFLKIPESFGRK
jgi:PAT family beta-lactamase induction signal transducer AmpG